MDHPTACVTFCTGELCSIKAAVSPSDTLLVVDAMTGQEAAGLVKTFNDAVDLTGAILTKMDGDSRGGAALSVRDVSGKPIKFVGVGEKMEALEPFYPERMAQRILGMGDMLTVGWVVVYLGGRGNAWPCRVATAGAAPRCV